MKHFHSLHQLWVPRWRWVAGCVIVFVLSGAAMVYTVGWLQWSLVVGSALGSALLSQIIIHWSLIKWLFFVSRRLDKLHPMTGPPLWFSEQQRGTVRWGDPPQDPTKWN